MDKPLWNHQLQGIAKLVSNDGYMLAMDMGTGKTRTEIEAIRRLFAQEGRVLKTLIICPIIVCENWKKEFGQYSRINQNDIVTLTKHGTNRVNTFLKAVGETLDRGKIIITNFNALLMDDLYNLFVAWRPDILVIDESHKVKNFEAKTTKRAIVLADASLRRHLLTGTPMGKSAMDLFAQFRIMDGGASFGQNFYTFRNTYFVDNNQAFKGKAHYFPEWVPRPEMHEVIRQKFAARALRVMAQDCMELPDVIEVRREVELSKEQHKLYEEMRRDFITFIEDAKTKMPIAVVAEMAVTKSMRMRQILAGFVKDEEGKIHRINNPRLEALRELLADLTPHHKVIVWSSFTDNYKMIFELCKDLKIQYAELHGGLSDREKNEEMERFRKDDNCRVIVANEKAGGTGVNLIEARYSIYYTKGYSLIDHQQSLKRNHRGGSIELHDKITRISLVATGTLDELVEEAITKGLNISKSIIDWRERL